MIGRAGTERRKHAFVPWLLWLVTLAAVGLGTFLGASERDEQARVKEAALAAADGATSRARAAARQVAKLQGELDAALRERDTLATRADELAALLAAKEHELADVEAQLAAAPGKRAGGATKGSPTNAANGAQRAKDGKPADAPQRPKDGKPQRSSQQPVRGGK